MRCFSFGILYIHDIQKFREKDLKTPLIKTQPGIVKVSTEKYANAD